MGTRVVGIDLPESGHFVSDPLLRFPSEHHLKAGELAPNLMVESDFGTRQETDCRFAIARWGEATRESVPKLSGHHPISKLGRS